MLTAQGDFISYLMDSIKETLNEPAAVLIKSDYTIAGKLEAAIRASNAQYDDPKARATCCCNPGILNPLLIPSCRIVREAAELAVFFMTS